MIGNKDVRSLKIKDLRKIIGVVLQDTTLFSGSIADNLRFGMEMLMKKWWIVQQGMLRPLSL